MPRRQATPLHVVVRAQARDARLGALGYASYDAYLSSPAWRGLRARYREERPWLCNTCGSECNLQLHHKTYERVGCERLDDLMPLCEPCHQMVHVLESRGLVGLDFEGVIDKSRALAGRALLAEQQAARVTEREQRRLEVDALPLGERVRRVREAAVRRRVDLSREFWMLDRLMQGSCAPKVIQRKLQTMERKAYGPEYWGEAA